MTEERGIFPQAPPLPGPLLHPMEYLFSETGTPQRGARTVPVRSAWAGRGALEKSDVFGLDNPLRTGTVRGPMQRDVPTGLNRYSTRAAVKTASLQSPPRPCSS